MSVRSVNLCFQKRFRSNFIEWGRGMKKCPFFISLQLNASSHTNKCPFSSGFFFVVVWTFQSCFSHNARRVDSHQFETSSFGGLCSQVFDMSHTTHTLLAYHPPPLLTHVTFPLQCPVSLCSMRWKPIECSDSQTLQRECECLCATLIKLM